MADYGIEQIREIIQAHGVDNLSAKTVRVRLEEKLGLESGSLKPNKEDISAKIDQVLEEMNDDNDEEAEEEDEEPAAKKPKKETKGNDNPNKGKMQCFTRSGEDCPKNIKKMQESVKGLSVKKFLESGKTVEITVDGNTLKGEPRSFSSGALGWYLGGKIEMDVGGATVWAQVGMNVVIPGSNSWKK